MTRRLLAVFIAITACSKDTRTPAAGSRQAPERIVCLTPSATEIVAALGAEDLIVGVDQFSTYPPRVRSLPRVGNFLSPNVDAILALTPDIAVLDEVQSEVATTLERSGIQVVTIRMHTLDDVRVALRKVGEALHDKEASDLAVARYDTGLAATAARVARRAPPGPRPRVLFVVDRQPGSLARMVGAGPDTFLDELLHRAGVENALADAGGRYVPISPEQIISRAPDIIIDGAHTEDAARALEDWAALTSVPAVRNHRVHILTDPRFFAPGPRLPDALSDLATLLWP